MTVTASDQAVTVTEGNKVTVTWKAGAAADLYTVTLMPKNTAYKPVTLAQNTAVSSVTWTVTPETLAMGDFAVTVTNQNGVTVSSSLSVTSSVTVR